MRLPSNVQMLPVILGEHHARSGDLRIAAEKVGDQFLAELFNAFGGGISRERIHRVFHRVGGKNFAVVPRDEAGLEVTFETDFDGPFPEIVSVAMPLHFYEADTRFAVIVFGELDHEISFPGTSCNHAG